VSASAPRPPRAWAWPLLLGLCALPFLLHAALLGDYLADDAGISLGYARNLAEGRGAVFQPGDAPVEGFSNPLWTGLLALAHAIGAPLPAA